MIHSLGMHENHQSSNFHSKKQIHSIVGPKRFQVFVKRGWNSNFLIASACSYCLILSKSFYNILSNSNKLGAMAKIHLILLGVKLYQYSENVLAYFIANPILKRVCTVSKWDIFVLVSSVHIYRHSLLGHSVFCYGVCKY